MEKLKVQCSLFNKVYSFGFRVSSFGFWDLVTIVIGIGALFLLRLRKIKVKKVPIGFKVYKVERQK